MTPQPPTMTLVSDPRYAQLVRRVQWSELDSKYLIQLIHLACEEDLEGLGVEQVPRIPGDATSRLLNPQARGSAALVTRSALVVCGIQLVPLIVRAYAPDAQVEFTAIARDGDLVPTGSEIGRLRGSVVHLLTAERVILNFLQHLSGVATQTARYVAALGDSSTRLLDTRKTTPGFRILEKYAVACGGGWNHRLGLYDRIMLKDNHLAVAAQTDASTLQDMVALARKRHPDLLVEIEVDQLAQIPSALEAKPDILLLDNFSIRDLKVALDQIGSQVYTEASGNVSLQTLPELATLGLDFISCGALIHQSRWVDIGLDWQSED